jgi:hypothetical protein
MRCCWRGGFGPAYSVPAGGEVLNLASNKLCLIIGDSIKFGELYSSYPQNKFSTLPRIAIGTVLL